MATTADAFEVASGYQAEGNLSLAEAYNNLGNTLYRQGKLAEASNAYEQAWRLLPDKPEILYNLGTVLHEQGELDQAVACYSAALRLNPAYAEASHNLATAFKEQGRFEEAVDQYRRTLEVRPEDALAYNNLSDLAAEGRYCFTAEDLDRTKALMARAGCSAMERSLCCFTFAAQLNKQGSYDEAFGYYKEANDLRKSLSQQSKTAFDAQSHEAIIDRIIASHDRAYFQRIQGWGTDTELPVFIIGMPRSGSTLVEQILASHPQVFGAGELGDMLRFIDKSGPEAPGKPYATAVLPHERTAREIANGYVQLIADVGKGSCRVTIKTLGNFMHLGVIATLFPRARIIHCRRDPLDVCLSCYFQNFLKIGFAWSLDDIGAYYRAYEKMMGHWSRVLPLEIHEVCYEDLVHNQETVTRNLLAYCGLDWNERCLAFYNTRRVVRTASSVQVRKPISAQSIGRWKHYRSHLGPLFQALGLSAEKARPEALALEPETGFRPSTIAAAVG